MIKSDSLVQKQARPSKIAIEVKELYPQNQKSVRGQKPLDSTIAEDSDGSD